MKGPLRRIRPGRRQADDPGQQHDPQATLVVPPGAAPTDVTVVQPPLDPAAPPPQATVIQPVVDPAAAAASTAPAEPLPAGMTPADVAPSRPSFRDRGRLRRRLRYLRRVRELGFRDLGGLAFDLHRFRRRNDELVLGKLAALDAVDRELRAIERVLGERRDIVELREPGIAACPRCGALHGSDANFCPQCGTQFSGPRAIGDVGGQPTPPEVSPAQEVLPLSGAEQGSTPVSGALAGNPPAEAPPVVAEPEATEAAGEGTPANGDAPTTVGEAAASGGEGAAAGESAPSGETPSAPAGAAPGESARSTESATSVDQPTQAFPALGDENGQGSAMTSGDPLASRERSAE